MAYRHILVPTDGSALARRAIAAADGLAASVGARITALYVIPEGVPTLFSGDKLYASPALAPRYRRALRAAAQRALGEVARAAARAGIPCAMLHTRAPAPWKAIVREAHARGCDLVVMGSRRRRGLEALGSQTLKAIAHMRTPVLVCR